MFWKKKEAKLSGSQAETAVLATPKSPQEVLEIAAKELASSLQDYADASYAARQATPSDELKAAYHKVQIAKSIVTNGRLSYALGRCLPEHMAHWHAWSQREDFMKWVGFEASNISSTQIVEEIGTHRVEVTTNDFTFNSRPYRLVFRHNGLSSVPGDNNHYGEVHFFAGDVCVAKFDVAKDLMDEWAEWHFIDVKGFRVGEWMKDVLDMAAQIETSRERSIENFNDERALKAASEIDLG